MGIFSVSTDSVAFDRAADYYDETRGFPPGEDRPIAALIARAGDFDASSRVLEIGIGTGRIALPLARHVRSLVGVDLARPMLDRLRAKQNGEPVEVMLGDATQLPFAVETFDAVVAVHVFHLIGNWQGALREAARVLRPGGMLVSGWSDSGHHRRDDVLWKAWNEVVKESSLPSVGVPRDQFETLMPEQGWQPAGAVLIHEYKTSRTPQQFLERLERGTWSRCWRLPEAVIVQGVAAVREAMQHYHIDPNQPVETLSAFRVRAYRPPLAEVTGGKK